VNGLLQRLVGQAVGVQGGATPPVRPAAGVSAQVPVTSPRDDDHVPAMPTLVQERPRSQAQNASTANPAQGAPSKEFTTLLQSVSGDRQFVAQSTISRPLETRAKPPLASREPPGEHETHDFVDKAPLPLLGQVKLESAPPMIKPVTAAALPGAVTSGDSRSEPTEVHVHIGRIEVIAGPEPAAPKKNRTAPARNTLPLADYLARRRS
jgi:hypothetical protein